MGFTAIIADDEPLLRANLRSRLAKLWPELSIVHEMENGRGILVSGIVHLLCRTRETGFRRRVRWRPAALS